MIDIPQEIFILYCQEEDMANKKKTEKKTVEHCEPEPEASTNSGGGATGSNPPQPPKKPEVDE